MATWLIKFKNQTNVITVSLSNQNSCNNKTDKHVSLGLIQFMRSLLVAN